MSNLWTFAPSSDAYLQRCLAAAPPPDPDNKWFQKFGKKTEMDAVNTKDVTLREINISGFKKDERFDYEEFFDTIMGESVIPVEYVLEECTKNTHIIPKMAEKLTFHAVEQLFKDIFSRKDVESRFIPFITSFLPTFLKKHNSRLCTDLLTKTSEYPHMFQQLIETIINDPETPNPPLNNYISGLNEQTATNFIETVSRIEISQEAFLQNVFSLYTAYKECNKEESIQNYIRTMIVRHSSICASDRNFGRMILLYLQSERSLGRMVDSELLQECLETHTSPFKRPCCNLLRDMST